MYRKVSIVLVAVVILCTMGGCAAASLPGLQASSNPTTTQQPPTSTTTAAVPDLPYFDLKMMPAEKKAEIESKWLQQKGVSLDWEKEYPLHSRFYGDFGACTVIFQPSQLTAVSSVEIAGYSFVFSSSFAMYAYANGDIIPLQDAYANGDVSQEQIAMIHAYHENYSGL